MKIVFAGTPEFAAQALQCLLLAGFDIPLVLTKPDRPTGRGMKTSPSAVKQQAAGRGLTVLQPTTLKHPETLERLKALTPDVMVVTAYGLILPQQVLALPRLGCINIHASLLPRWRGAAPIQRALLAGDKETGITIMLMNEGLDTGPILLQRRVKITADDTAQTLHDKLAQLGGECIVSALRKLEQGELIAQPQPEAGASYAAKIDKAEAAIDWQQEAAQIERAVRAFNPLPGAFTSFNGETLKIWKARVVNAVAGKPGQIVSVDRDNIVVACGNGGLRLEELQKSGGRRLPVQAFLSGFALKPGQRFGP